MERIHILFVQHKLVCGGAEQAAEYILKQAPETAAAEQNGRA